MFRLFSTPEWFNGIDLIFALVSLVISLLIARYSWKIYHINRENKFGYFSFAFVLIALSNFFKLVTNVIIYYRPWRILASNVVAPIVDNLIGNSPSYVDLLFRSGFFLSMVTALGAWLLIFFISQRKTGRLKNYYETTQIGLFVYLVGLISVVAIFKSSVFYLTSTVIISLTVLNYYKNYLNTNKNHNARNVLYSFLLILAGNLSFIFVFLRQGLYVIGEVLVLFGFLLLLYTHYRVTRR